MKKIKGFPQEQVTETIERKNNNRMKLTYIVIAMAALIITVPAHADTAIYDITVNNTAKTVDGWFSTYTKNATDNFTVRVNGVAVLHNGQPVYSAGAHRGIPYSPDPIGKILKTSGGSGGGGGGGKLNGPQQEGPGNVKFSLNFTDNRTGITTSYSLNISFMSGSISFSGTYSSGFSFSSYSPSTSSTSFSNSGVTGGHYVWPFGEFAAE